VYILFLALFSLVVEKCRTVDAFVIFFVMNEARITLATGLDIMFAVRVVGLRIAKRAECL